MSADRDALGIVQSFRPGQHELVEACIEDIARLGLRHLRTVVSWSDYNDDGGREWYSWLFATLGTRFELLPSLCHTLPLAAGNGPVSSSSGDPPAFAGFVEHVLTTHGGYFDAIELGTVWSQDPARQEFSALIGAAATRARQHGKTVVLGTPCTVDPNWIRKIGETGLLKSVDVIGVRSCPDIRDRADGSGCPGWQRLIDDAREAAAPFNDRLDFWITQAGCSTWQHDVYSQLRRFLDAREAPAERLYWYSLRDMQADGRTGDGQDPRRLHFGIHHTDGRPKLLGRLLRDGLPTVERLAGARRTAAIVGSRQPLLITGGAGFIGCNLADRLASQGENVLIYDSLERSGVEANLDWLRGRHPTRISAAIADTRDRHALNEAVRGAAGVFHFAAQVAVTTSMQLPYEDLEVNLLATVNLLEALRHKPLPCVFASTNKVYGDLSGAQLVCLDETYAPVDDRLRRYGIDESERLDFRTPYGCSKGAADQYVLDYARNFRVPTAVMRMSCIYGPRQLGGEDQGWVAHFLLRALAGQEITIYGDGKQVRDLLFVDDAVNAYVTAWRNIGRIAGQAFNLGGGPTNAVSLLQVIQHISRLLDRPVDLRFAPWRPNDQRYYVSDARRVRAELDLPAPTDWRIGVAKLLQHYADARGIRMPAGASINSDEVASA